MPWEATSSAHAASIAFSASVSGTRIVSASVPVNR
jgi:hypothetical protein